MKRKITFLIAALAALMMLALPTRLWAEDPEASFTVTGLSSLPSSIASSPTGFTMSYVQNTGSNAPTVSGTSLRLYPNNQMTIVSDNGNTKFKTVTFNMTITASKKGYYPGISATSGSFDPETSSITTSTNTITWTADGDGVTTITFTFPPMQATAGGNWTFSGVSLTYEGGGSTPTVTISSPLTLPATANDNGTIDVAYNSITPNGGSIQFYNNSECTGDPITPDWFTATFATTSKATDYHHINYTVTQNNTGSARPVYMKVTLTDGTNSPYAIVSISQYPYYTVTFNGHGGTYNSNLSYTQNIPGGVETALQTNQFVYASHIFTGWNTNENGSGTAYTNGQSVTLTAPLTLYAQWAQIYTVTINAMTHGNVTADPSSATAGTEITLTITPEPGYVLDGSVSVKKANNEDVSVSNNKFTMPESNVTVSASFRAAQIYAKYSGSLTEGDYIISSSTNCALSNSYDGTNTRFAGTSISPSSNQVIDPETSIVWHIASSGNSWTIYNTNDSKYVTGTGSASHAGYVTTPSNNQELWTITEVSTGSYTIVNNYNTSNKVNADLRWGGSYWACYAAGGSLNLYRKVVNSTMTVASVENGNISATPTGGSAIDENGSATVSSGTNVTLSAVGTGSYVLDAWNVYKSGESGTKVTVTNSSFVMPDYDVIVSASFRLPITFTVQYSVNGNIVDGLTVSGIPEGNSVTLPNSDQVTPPNGYKFVGWTEDETSDATISGLNYTPSDDKTLYLVFVESDKTVGWNKITSRANITPGRYFIVSNLRALPNVTTSNASPTYSDTYKVGNTLADTYNTLPVDNSEWIFSGTNKAMRIQNSNGHYLYVSGNGNTNIRVSNTSDTWRFIDNGGGFAMKDTLQGRFCASAPDYSDWRSYTTAGASNYGDSGKLYLYKKTQAYTRIYNTAETIMENIPATYKVTVPFGVTLTLTGTNFGDENNLVIEDGGQLIVSTSGVKATFKKTIDATTRASYWNTISSPIGRKEISTVPNLVSGDGLTYNLYRYNETVPNNQWEAYNLDNTSASYHSDFTHLEKGHGYLYRNNGPDIEYAGTVNTENVDIKLTASATALAELKGFNLIGNPFGQNITMGNLSGVTLSGGYVLSNDGNWGADPVAIIHPCEGFLVQVAEETDITITKPVSRGTTYNREYIKFTVSNSQYEDATYALFDNSYGLNKINHRNPDIPMLYINKDNRDLAIATMSDDTKSFNLNFKAMTMGQYTLSYKATGEYSYLHVIDRFTGEDVDMLLEGEYEFVATPNDNEARFIVKLGYMPDYSDVENDIFAYQNGSEILVSGEGELQIFDVTGRNVMTTIINGAESINIPAQGVYIFRLVGNEIKTQKIVVR